MNEVYMKCLSVLASCGSEDHFIAFDRYIDLARDQGHLTDIQFFSLLDRSYVLETELFEKEWLERATGSL